jgi:hypothetical protein
VGSAMLSRSEPTVKVLDCDVQPRQGRLAVGRLVGKVSLITGAARGQGVAKARLFAAEGAAVVMTDVLDEPGEALAATLRSQGASASSILMSRRRSNGERLSIMCGGRTVDSMFSSTMQGWRSGMACSTRPSTNGTPYFA